MKWILGIGFVLTFFSLNAIEAEELIAKVNAVYSDAKSMEYSATYDLFKGETSKTVHTSYDGYTYRNGKQVHQKLDQTEYVLGINFSLTISHPDKQIRLLDASTLPKGNENLQDAFKNCIEKSVTETDTYYTVKLVYNSMIAPLSVMSIRIEKGSFHLVQLDLYYSMPQDFSASNIEKDLATPHLRITFKDVSTNPADKKHLLELSSYIQNSNNLLNPVDAYDGYVLQDNRLK